MYTYVYRAWLLRGQAPLLYYWGAPVPPPGPPGSYSTEVVKNCLLLVSKPLIAVTDIANLSILSAMPIDHKGYIRNREVQLQAK